MGPLDHALDAWSHPGGGLVLASLDRIVRRSDRTALITALTYCIVARVVVSAIYNTINISWTMHSTGAEDES